MTEEEYNNAVKRSKELSNELYMLDSSIFKYENEHKRPIFTEIGEIKSFIRDGASEGSLFTYQGKTYQVGDYEELLKEYGWESVSDCMYSATMDDLDGGTLSIITLID